MGEPAHAHTVDISATPAGAAIHPADLSQRLKASATAGFAGRKVITADGTFRASRLDRVQRIDTPYTEAELIDASPAPVPVPVPVPQADPETLLAEARAEAHATGKAEGLADGLAQGRGEGRAEAEAALAAARDAFTAAAKAVMAGDATPDGLTDLLAKAVRDLAAQRAGQAIDALPAPFLARVAALADRVAQGMRTVTLRLNPDDLAAIAPHLAGSDLDGAALNPDPRLKRGDVEVRSEGIVLSDLLDTP